MSANRTALLVLLGTLLGSAAAPAWAEPKTTVMVVTVTLTTEERTWSAPRRRELELSVKRMQHGKLLDSFTYRTHRHAVRGACRSLRLYSDASNSLYCANDDATRRAFGAKLAELQAQATPLVSQATIDTALLDYQKRAGVTSDAALRRTIDDLATTVRELQAQVRILQAERGAHSPRR